MYLKILVREKNLVYVKKEYWDQNTPSISPRALGTKKKFGQERVDRAELSKNVHHMSVVLARQNSEKYHMRRLCTKKDAPAKAAWDLAKILKSSRIRTKLRFHTPVETRAMQAPITSKSSEELEFVVDSGASLHMMSKKDLSSEEMGTVKRSRNPTVVLTANGEVHTHEEAQVFVHDLNLFVTVQFLERRPRILLMGGSAVISHD